MRIVTVTLEDPPPLLDHNPSLVWMSEQTTLIGHGEALRVAAGFGPRRFRVAESAFAEWVDGQDIDDRVGVTGSGPVAFGSFTFDDRSAGSVLVVPEVTIGHTRGRWFVTTVGDVDPEPLLVPEPWSPAETDRPRFAGASIPDIAWVEAVAQVISRIRSGEARKVVMARDFALWSRTRFDTRRLLDRLVGRFPGCFTFSVDGLVGASPELLVRSDGTMVESVALAGTIGRSTDTETDELLGKQLLSSEKDLLEHRLAATSVFDALDAVTRHLEHDRHPTIRKLDNVQHLATAFRGELVERMSALALVERLHPTAAVGGDPTDVAVGMIRELEGMDRGRYAGPVGWMDAHGTGEFAIALRCAEISGARARLFTGAGIMSDSLPEKELEETRLKLGAMLDALG